MATGTNLHLSPVSSNLQTTRLSWFKHLTFNMPGRLDIKQRGMAMLTFLNGVIDNMVRVIDGFKTASLVSLLASSFFT